MCTDCGAIMIEGVIRDPAKNAKSPKGDSADRLRRNAR
jgi:hypothetical protein